MVSSSRSGTGEFGRAGREEETDESRAVLEGIPAIVLFGPLLFPVAHQLGIHEVHYAMVVVLSMGLGVFGPPFGLCYYAACIIGEVSPEAGLRRIWIYLGMLLLGLIAIAFVPWISTAFL